MIRKERMVDETGQSRSEGPRRRVATLTLVGTAIFSSFLILVASGVCLQAETEGKGSSDHFLFPSRIPAFSMPWSGRDGFAGFHIETGQRTIVEVQCTKHVCIVEQKQFASGGLAIGRNLENAARVAEEKVLLTHRYHELTKALRGGQGICGQVENWFRVSRYIIHVLERQTILQVIKAETLSTGLVTNRLVALDFRIPSGRAEIQPEPLPTIAEIAKMLKNWQELRVDAGDTQTTPDHPQQASLGRKGDPARWLWQ